MDARDASNHVMRRGAQQCCDVLQCVQVLLVWFLTDSWNMTQREVSCNAVRL